MEAAALAIKRSDKSADMPPLPPASPRHPGRAAGAIASAQVLKNTLMRQQVVCDMLSKIAGAEKHAHETASRL